jgi:hypothetical protein
VTLILRFAAAVRLIFFLVTALGVRPQQMIVAQLWFPLQTLCFYSSKTSKTYIVT